MDIVIQKGIAPEAWTSLTDWSDAPFPAEGRGLEWAPLRWHVLAMENGRAVAHVGFDRFTVKQGGIDTSVVGVGKVIVRPEFQKQGLPGKMLERLYAECPPDARADTYALFCAERLVPYYERHGFVPLKRPVRMRQAGKTVAMPMPLLTRGAALAPTGGEILLTSAPW